jgi:hypothetical protein
VCGLSEARVAATRWVLRLVREPSVFAAVARMCAARAAVSALGGARVQRRGGCCGSDAAVLLGAARGARLAVRLAIGRDPHLIEEWTRNQ